MDNREIVEILAHAGFHSEEEVSVLDFARAGKQARMAVIQGESANHHMQCHCAAIEITRYWRGYKCRSKIRELFTKNDSTAKPPESTNHESSSQANVLPSAEVLVEMEKIDSVGTNSVDVDPISNEAIEEAPTDTALNPEKSSPLPENIAVDVTTVKDTEPPVKSKQPDNIVRKFTHSQAATLIQKAWRRHIDTQVFRYYRDLINFRRQGNPALMLRCINPAEAKLLDAATGTHIKFRLAGEKFPPNIYYKIFTHRPVVDMCANSPKDYTRPDAKQANFKQLHNKNQPLPNKEGDGGWYKRFENNGWRLVSDRLIHAAMDPTTWETAKKKVEFHHDRLVRQADIDKKRREKKIAWMHKMYKQGMLQVKVQDPETSALVKKATDGLIHTVDSQGAEGVMDWEVDELLQWTTALNFDDYLEGWKESATSNVSEFEVEEMIADKVSKANSKVGVNFVSYSFYNEATTENKEQTPNFNTIEVP